MLQRGCDGDDLLHKRDFQMIGKRQSAGTGDDRGDGKLTELLCCFCDQSRECVLNIGIMTPVIRKKELLIGAQNGDLDGRGTNVNAKGMYCCR